MRASRIGNERGIPLLGCRVPLRAIGRYFLSARESSVPFRIGSRLQTRRLSGGIQPGGSSRGGFETARFPKRGGGEYFRVTDLRRFRMRGDEVSICTRLHRLRIRGTAPLANLWKHNVTTLSNICTFRIELHDRCFCLSRRRDIALSPPGRF